GLDEPLNLIQGSDVTVVTGGDGLRNGELPIAPAAIGEVLRQGHEVLIADGMIRLRVESVESGRARCAVVVGGTVTSQKGVNLPGVPIPIPSLTRKDLEDLEFALGLGCDFIALSFVRSAADVRDLKALLEQEGSNAHVIAKIEKSEAVDSLDDVLVETDAVMVSGETAVGEFPVQAVQTMDKIARAVEPSLGYRHQIPEAIDDPTIGNAMSNAACDLAEALGAAAILVPTFTGRTASAVARLRPRRPIVALTHKRWSVHQMAIEWGVTPLWIPECKDVEDLWNRSVGAARESGLVEHGDTIVITAGTAVNIPGSTNVIKVDVA